MTMSKYDRRDLFKAFGASALFLHPLLSLRDAKAEEVVKRRLLNFHTSSGTIADSWWPKKNGKAFDLTGKTLEALKPYADDLTFVRGTKNYHGKWDSHSSGMVNLMTGLPATPDYRSSDKFARKMSYDQMLAERWAGQTSMKSLVLAIVPTRERPSTYAAYKGDGSYVPQIRDPYSAFNQIFKDLIFICDPSKAPDAAKLALLKAKKKSILDAITSDLKDAVRLNDLSANEKAKLESYTESVRELEANLNGLSQESAAACKTLDSFLNQPKVPVNAENYPKVARLMLDLMVAAFQLDITRVSSVVWSVGGSDGVPSTFAKFNGKPILESYHSLTHQADPKNYKEKLKILDRYHAGEFAYLIQKLKESAEGSSNLLDNSLVVWKSEIANGVNHSAANIPVLMAGKAGGNVKGGQFIDASLDGKDVNPIQNLVVSILQAMGLGDVKSFGTTQFTGGLPVDRPIKLK